MKKNGQQIPFFKYHGAGNDFILLDHRSGSKIDLQDESLIRRLCDRHFGIGADGLISLQHAAGADFEMKYYNADGREGTMCGNGGRCTVAFAGQLGIRSEPYQFLAADGPHQAFLRDEGWVELKMGDVQSVEAGDGYFYLDTGSPHYVSFVKDIGIIDVCRLGKAIRYNDRFRAEGTNVDFVAEEGFGISVATYERGVEDETLSCGTGITAAALAFFLKKGGNSSEQVRIPVRAKGGMLEVRFRKTEQGFSDIWLCGPTQFVYQGYFLLSLV